MKNYSLGLYEKAMPDYLSFEQMLVATKESGFDFCEISIDESDKRLMRIYNQNGELNTLKYAMDKTEMRFQTMCLSGHRKYPLGSHDVNIREKSLEIMQKAVDFSYKLGIRMIQLAGYDVYYEQPDNDTRRWFIENLKRAVDIAATKGVLLAFETMETPLMDTIAKSREFVELINSPYLKIYPDIGNLTNASKLYGTDVIDDLKLGAGMIAAAHLKETLPNVYRDMQFGTGHTDYLRCIAELYLQGVRSFTGEFWYAGEQDWQQTLTDAAVFLRNKIDPYVKGSKEELC